MSYPFGVQSQDNYDIKKAEQILDEDHYGMKQVKQRILEFIAVGKLKGSFKCKIVNTFSKGTVVVWTTWCR
jgi:Lon-like ATP-dependent protease